VSRIGNPPGAHSTCALADCGFPLRQRAGENRPLAGRFRRPAGTHCSSQELPVRCTTKRARLRASSWSAATLTPLWLGHGCFRAVFGVAWIPRCLGGCSEIKCGGLALGHNIDLEARLARRPADGGPTSTSALTTSRREQFGLQPS